MAESLFPDPNDIVLGRYKIIEEIGRGGFSVVYKAVDPQIGDHVAIKVLVPPPANAKTAFARLKREALTMRGLNHPHIVHAHDVIVESNRALLIMQLIEGMDAGNLSESGPMLETSTAKIGAEIADALSCAHSAGIVHRDIKPQNILIDAQKKSWLTDFGSAQILGQSSLTITGGLTGTIGFLAPELIATGKGDSRADIYSLGITLYFILTGKMPGGKNALMIQATMKGFDPREQIPNVSEELATVISHATKLDPADRFQTAESLRRALLNGQGSTLATLASAPPALICLACGEEGTSDLGICKRCLKQRNFINDSLIYLHPISKNQQKLLDSKLQALLPAKAKSHIIRETMQGVRPLICTNTKLAMDVISQLKLAGIEAYSVSIGSFRNFVPSDIFMISSTIIALSMLASTFVGNGFILPSIALCSALIYFSREIVTQSLVDCVKQESNLSPILQKRIDDTTLNLLDSHLRKNLSRMIAVAEGLLKSTSQSPEITTNLEGLLGMACTLCDRISALDEASQSVGQLGNSEKSLEYLLKIEKIRETAMHQFLRISAVISEYYVFWNSADQENEVVIANRDLVLKDIEHTNKLYHEAYQELGLI